MKKYNYAIYHKNCQDGFSSLIVLLKSKRLSKDAIIYHDVPSTNFSPKGIDNKDIIIMDVAYKYDVLQDIFERAKTVVFIDHHITIRDDVKKLSEMKKYKKKVTIVYDIEESGASLTWKFFFNNEDMPMFIKYIRDNDIGKWELNNTRAFIYGLRVNYDIDLKKDIVHKWKELFDDNKVKKVVKKGKIYEEYANSLLKENIRKYSLEAFPSKEIYMKFTDFFTKPGQYKVAVTNNACPNASILGNKIMETVDCDFVMIWSFQLDKKEYIVSFRSKNVDVGKIASIFGGGGHTLASACSFSANKYNIQDLFFPISLPRS